MGAYADGRGAYGEFRGRKLMTRGRKGRRAKIFLKIQKYLVQKGAEGRNREKTKLEAADGLLASLFKS